MTAPVTYDYATGNLLEDRNTYFYSRYGGAAFLAAWRAQRDEAARPAAAAADGNDDDPAVLGPTDRLLAEIRAGLGHDGAASARLADLDKLVQRFEVTKRLHAAYNERWRAVDPADFAGLDRYVCFGETLVLAYSVTRGLQYLNALLKCLDTVTALRAGLTAEQQQRLRDLIGHERSFVDQLMRATGADGGIHGA
ncbi:MAG: hypothetical protein ACM33T_14930 [Solirubrobacterales bacterium]